MRVLLSLLALSIISPGMAAQEKPKVPKGTIELSVVGCLKGRILSTTRAPEVVEGDDIDVPVDRFQVAGKKALLDEVKTYERRREQVEVVGLVRKSDLKEPGIPVPGGRIVISPGRGGDRYGPPPAPAQRVVLLEATSIKPLDRPCER